MPARGCRGSSERTRRTRAWTSSAPATSAGDWTFTLDAWGWQTAATPGSGQAIAQVFDAFGRVLTRTQGAQTTELTYEGTGETLSKQVVASTTTTYASTPGGPLAQKVGSGAPEYFLRDLHGDVVGLVGSSSTTPSARAYYSPWGEPTWSTAAPALGFQSQRTDPATGQVDMTTRNYLPGLGRFSSRDVVFGELTDPLTLNQFAYAGASPITFADPLGLGYKAGGGGGCSGECTDADTDPDPSPQPHPSPSPALADPDGPGPQQLPHPTGAPPGPKPDVRDTAGIQLKCAIEDCTPRVLRFLYALTLEDFVTCARGSKTGCVWAAIGVAPIGKVVDKLRDFVASVHAGRGLRAGLTGLRAATRAEDVFVNNHALLRHFHKHGVSFGARTADEYAALARDFLVQGYDSRTLLIKVDAAAGKIRALDVASRTVGVYRLSDARAITLFVRRDPDIMTYWASQPGIVPRL